MRTRIAGPGQAKRGTGSTGFKKRIALLMAMTAGLSACVPAASGPAPRIQQVRAAPPRPMVTVPPPRPARPLPPSPPQALVAAIDRLGASFGGDAGIAVMDIEQGWMIDHNGDRFYPQQSVSKLWVAITALDAVDRGALKLSEQRTVTTSDLTLFHQPIAARIAGDGFDTTYGELMTTALRMSDNTANDIVLRRLGGPAAIREMISRKQLGAINFGNGERALQSEIAGLEWRQDYASGSGRGFYRARAALPMDKRQAAMKRYLERPMDGITPTAMVTALSRLSRGELLTAQSTSLLLRTMAESRTGPQRLKGGLPLGWQLSHKTGTGQDLGGMVAGYNDVGIITAPGGHRYAVAVLIGNTRLGIPARQQLMQGVVRSLVATHQSSTIASIGGSGG